MKSEDTEKRILTTLDRAGLKIGGSIVQIAGDLSPRRYYRIQLLDYKAPSIVAMVFDSVKPPEAETKVLRTSDEAYVELTRFFETQKLPVPSIILDAKDSGILLIEDLGDTPIIDLVTRKDVNIEKYYSEAVGLIHRIQSIPYDDTIFAFERSLDFSTFFRESRQFVDFVLPEGISSDLAESFLSHIKYLCEEVSSFEKVLVHRDFHSWNLMIDNQAKLRLIDFQDALLGPRPYDLVALLHERDIDSLLNLELIEKLENNFFSVFSDPRVREFEYPRVQLQRDLKVSGLFKRIVKQRGLLRYGEWVPGTLKRMEKTLVVLALQDPKYAEFKRMFSEIF